MKSMKRRTVTVVGFAPGGGTDILDTMAAATDGVAEANDRLDS